MTSYDTVQIGFIGFGEAASAFVEGWGAQRTQSIAAYDIKTDAVSVDVRVSKLTDYVRWSVTGCGAPAELLEHANLVFSMVTADQASVAAQSAAEHVTTGTLYLDCNSCAPGTKRCSAALINGAGGRYVDVAVMAPVHPKLHKTPLLLSGPHAGEALEILRRMDMDADIVPGEVGASSSVKMIRSVFIKGLEALVVEGVLAGCEAGVNERVLDSLEVSYPGFGWKQRAAYMLERVMTHGVRRAAEMREVALTVNELDLGNDMARATIAWQQRVGELGLRNPRGDYKALAAMVRQGLRETAKE